MGKQEELDKLIIKYRKLNDELMEFTNGYHDNIMYDADGYRESYYEYEDDPELLEEDINDIKRQIDAITLILNGHKKLKYKYG